KSAYRQRRSCIREVRCLQKPRRWQNIFRLSRFRDQRKVQRTCCTKKPAGILQRKTQPQSPCQGSAVNNKIHFLGVPTRYSEIAIFEYAISEYSRSGYPLYFAEPHCDASLLVPAPIPHV